MRKLLFTFLLSSSILGIIACCNGIPEFWVLNDFEIIVVDSLGVVPSNNEFTDDVLRIQINLDGDMIAQNNYSEFFINSTIATSCPEPGFRGLEDAITNITLFTLHPFNQFSANADISNIVEWDGLLLAEYAVGLNQSPPIWLMNSNLIISEKPINQTEHQFRVRIEFESGRVLDQTTEVINWI